MEPIGVAFWLAGAGATFAFMPPIKDDEMNAPSWLVLICIWPIVAGVMVALERQRRMRKSRNAKERSMRRWLVDVVIGWRKAASSRHMVGLLLAIASLNWALRDARDGEWWGVFFAALMIFIGIYEFLAKPKTEEQ